MNAPTINIAGSRATTPVTAAQITANIAITNTTTNNNKNNTIISIPPLICVC